MIQKWNDDGDDKNNLRPDKGFDIFKFTMQLGGQSDMVWCYSGLKI